MSQALDMMRVQQTAKSAAQGREPVSFAEFHRAAIAESEERDMEWFSNRTYQDLAQADVHRSICKAAVDITPEGLNSMKNDPSYRQQVLDAVRRDFGASYYPRQINLMIHVGDEIGEYTTQTWSAGDDQAFLEKSVGSFYRTENTPAAVSAASAGIVDPGAYRFFRPQTKAPRTRSTAYQAAAYGIR